jgi:hypothetical protein
MILIQLVIVVILLTVIVILSHLTISLAFGAPYIHTALADRRRIIASMNLRAGSRFLELGMGDGSMLFEVMRTYPVYGRGVEVSALWHLIARMKYQYICRDPLRKPHEIPELLCGRIQDTDLGWADTIYLFMLPRFLRSPSFHTQLTTQLRPGMKIYSYGFSITHTRLRLTHTLPTERYKTYVYEVEA